MTSNKQQNFLIFAANNYDTSNCCDVDEFLYDLKRITFVKKLLTRYKKHGELKERLIINHLIVLHNIFGPAFIPMVFFDIPEYYSELKSFLEFMNLLPAFIYIPMKDIIIDTSSIEIDENIMEILEREVA